MEQTVTPFIEPQRNPVAAYADRAVVTERLAQGSSTQPRQAMHTDHYAILGLTHSATPEDIRRAYERLRQALGADAAAAQRLEQIKAAYEVLSDANKRTLYDLESMERELDARERELDSDLFGPPSAIVNPDAAQQNGTSFEEELASVLAELQRPRAAKARAARSEPGAVERAVPSRPLRGADCEVILEISQEQAIRGATIPVNCPMNQRGAGTVDASERTVKVQVPKLVRHGQRLLLKGMGAPGINGGEAGDLHVEIAYKHHPLFRLNGDDIWFYLPIAPWEAVLGAILEMPTLEGPFRVHVPAGATSGQVFRLVGRGLPKTDGGRGDLLACLRITTPKESTELERQLYLQLAQVSRFNPRRGIG